MKTFKDEMSKALKEKGIEVDWNINTRDFFNETMETPKPVNLDKLKVKTFQRISFMDAVIDSHIKGTIEKLDNEILNDCNNRHK